MIKYVTKYVFITIWMSKKKQIKNELKLELNYK